MGINYKSLVIKDDIFIKMMKGGRHKYVYRGNILLGWKNSDYLFN